MLPRVRKGEKCSLIISGRSDLIRRKNLRQRFIGGHHQIAALYRKRIWLNAGSVPDVKGRWTLPALVEIRCTETLAPGVP